MATRHSPLHTRRNFLILAISTALILAFTACPEPEPTTYTVTFNANGGSGTAPSPQTANSGSSITIPNDNGLTKNGYTFGGWNANAEGTGTNYAVNSSYTVTATVTLYAKWIAEGTATYTVTFNANGGSGTAPSAQTASSGSSITIPNDNGLTKNGYTFGGWNVNADGAGTNHTVGSSYTVTANITLYAKWNVAGTTNYTVTFNSNGGSTVNQITGVASGTTIAKPADPTKANSIFDGWYKEAGLTNAWNFTTDTVTQNITLYAKWNENASTTVTVTFNTDGGSNVNSQTVETGGYANRPANNPTKTGYTFVDWYTSAEYEYLFNFNIPINSSRTAYAKWTVNQYTITFDSNGGTPAPEQQIINYGSKAAEPQNVTRSGHTFAGWYKEAGLTNAWNFATDTVTQDITLYAKWTCTVTFNSNGGSAVAAQTVDHGSKAAEPQGFTQSGALLVGWYRNETAQWNFATDTVTQDMTLYAKWMSAPEMVFVPGGTFQLGKALGTVTGSNNPDVTPVSNVTLSSFYIDKYEVKQEQWQAVMGTTIQQLQTAASGGSTNYGRGNSYPIYCVSWYDALVFCNKLSILEGLTPAYRISNSANPDDWGTVPTSGNATWNAVTIVEGSTGYRLPTEAQWEYAAKGGNTGETFTYAGSDTIGDVAWYAYNSGYNGGTQNKKSHEVGTKAPNGLSLYDMSGNVQELCWDWRGNYTSDDKTDPTGASSGSGRVNRGGGWNWTTEYVRSAYRNNEYPYNRYNYLGLRLARPAN